jgi:amino acid adenylation domain-containing protein
VTGLHRLVRDAAARTPDAPALHVDDVTLTYRELDELADRHAAALAGAGVREGDRVVIWAAKSVHVVALMQAALRLGALYVPVAPTNPASRVARIAAACAPVLVLTDADGLRAADALLAADAVLTAEGVEWPAPVVGIADPPDTGAGPPSEPADTDEDRPAYLLYTSGSTGEPKGVLISHRNALAFLRWAVAETGLRPEDRLSNHAPFNFDLSVFDLYGAFLVGASVDVVPADLAYSPAELLEFLHRRRITVWYSVPSALLLMMRFGGLRQRPVPPALRVCVFAGEPFPVSSVVELRSAWTGVRLFNWYGPTETNVCTSFEVTDADLSQLSALPIGRACSGDTVELDPPDAAEGEIVVHGPTVMLGYWGEPRQCGGYRTGDIGRRDERGDLVYVGRRDAMVKVRGHRIELGEIEAVLSGHPAVAEVAVVVVGVGIDTRLRAVVVPTGNGRPGLLALKAHCAAHLPRYMIVDDIVVVTDLPRTPNGKTDRRTL